MRTLLRRLAFLALLAVGVSFASATSVPPWALPLDAVLPPGSSHRADVPTPTEYFGFAVGERHAYTHEVRGYFAALEAASPRVKRVPYARSHGGRELYLVIITAPENHAKLDVLLEQHRRASVPGATPAPDAPLVIWLGYAVHGNESSASNAAPIVGYHLAAADDAQTTEWLKRTIVILDPTLNPDGMDRFASWANDHRGRTPNPDSQTREHVEGFPTGRVNGYWFDLNRDWLPLAHPESRGRMEQLHRWRPHVLGDFHEMGTNATYFFQPGVPTRVHPLTPRRNQELTAKIADFHAAALDRLGVIYFTGERYDDFYMGKGSAYPDLYGMVGILFEQASSRGHWQNSIHGVLTFGQTIRNQVATSLSTLAGAESVRAELQAWQREFYAESARQAAADPVAYHVLGAEGDPVRLDKLVLLLAAHQIESRAVAREFTLEGRVFRPGEAVVVPVAQREYRYLKAIFEARTQFEENAFYDLSTWMITAAYQVARVDTKTLPEGVLGPVIGHLPIRVAPPPVETTVGWVIDAEGLNVPRALIRLLERGFFVKASAEPMRLVAVGAPAPVELPRGSLFLPVAMQNGRVAELHALLTQLAEEESVRIHAVATGLTPVGPDLGSSTFGVVRRASVLLVMGPSTSQTEAGALWHALDHEYELPVTLVETTRMASVDLTNYTAIILPPGTYRQMAAGAAEALKAWVEQGGTLISVGSAANWVGSEKLANVERRRGDREVTGPRPFGEAESDRALDLIAGAILRVQADLTHPLLFGYRESELQLFRTERVILEPAKNRYQTPLRVALDPLIAGYLSAGNQRALAGSAAALVETSGRGQVIVLADHPTFRGYTRGSNRLLFNAIFHAPMMRLSNSGGGDDEEN